MAVGSARSNRLIVAASLILASCLLSVLPHRHAVTAREIPSVSGEEARAPHANPGIEPGAAPHSRGPCAVCCFQRLLSGGQIATCDCGAPVFLPTRMPAPSLAASRPARAGSAAPRGPPAA